MQPMKIFVSGPYSAETKEERERNALKAVDAGIRLLKRGHTPFVPHLTHWMDTRALELGYEFSWQHYMDYDDEWLQECEAILHLGSSKGADIELSRAKELGLRIFYDEAEIPAAA